MCLFASLFVCLDCDRKRKSGLRQHPSKATMQTRRQAGRQVVRLGDAISVLYLVRVSQTAFVSVEFRLMVSSVTAVIPSSFCRSSVI